MLMRCDGREESEHQSSNQLMQIHTIIINLDYYYLSIGRTKQKFTQDALFFFSPFIFRLANEQFIN